MYILTHKSIYLLFKYIVYFFLCNVVVPYGF